MNFKNKVKILLKLPYSVFLSMRKAPQVMSDRETIEYILSNKCSIGRFGDGELYLMNGIGIKFQQYEPALKKRLIEVANNSDERFLTCIPNVFGKKSLSKDIFTDSSRSFWKKNLFVARGLWYSVINRKRIYGDALLTRFYMDKKDKRRVPEYIDELKKIWDKRDLVIVEGEHSKIGVGNDLFDNAESIKRVICPSVNAFSKYEEILKSTLAATSESDLILIALGPTATVLSYDLMLNNRQALDLGHIDIEYEWYLAHAEKKIVIDGKCSAEVQDYNVKISDDRPVENIVKKI